MLQVGSPLYVGILGSTALHPTTLAVDTILDFLKVSFIPSSTDLPPSVLAIVVNLDGESILSLIVCLTYRDHIWDQCNLPALDTL